MKAETGGYRIDGKLHLRATTVTGCMPKPWLAAWASKLVAEHVVENFPTVAAMVAVDPMDAVRYLKGIPNSKRDLAGERGTRVHEIAEAWAKGEPLPPILDGEGGYVDAVLAFLSDFQPRIEQTEATVCDPDLGVAGTFDATAIIDGDRWLLDWKTGKGVYDEYAPQLAFYMHAPYEVLGDGSLRVRPVMPERAGVVHLRPDGEYELAEVADWHHAYEVFCALVKVARYTAGKDPLFRPVPVPESVA